MHMPLRYLRLRTGAYHDKAGWCVHRDSDDLCSTAGRRARAGQFLKPGRADGWWWGTLEVQVRCRMVDAAREEAAVRPVPQSTAHEEAAAPASVDRDGAPD